MPVILTDANIEGQGARLWSRMQAADWRDFTSALGVELRTFREVGLDPAARDDVIWRFCQTQGFYLLTSNRNEDAEDSLEATIRHEGLPTSLPVFTIAMADRVLRDSTFVDRIVEKLFDFLLYADNIRGAGRLYVP